MKIESGYMNLEQMFEAGRVGYVDQKLSEAKELYDTLRVTHVSLQSSYGIAQNAVRLMQETLASYLALLVENNLMAPDEVPNEFRPTVKVYQEKLLRGDKLTIDLSKLFEEIRVVIPPKFTY